MSTTPRLIKPWDGPASISFTDGQCIGAVLDRNGLAAEPLLRHARRPRVIMASRVGVLDIDPTTVKLKKRRLQPGKMFLVDFEQGRIIGQTRSSKKDVCRRRPYGEWLQGSAAGAQRAPRRPRRAAHPRRRAPAADAGVRLQHSRRCSSCSISMLNSKKDPINSMGDDTALACLSDQPRMLYDYFRQLFAQVTNPAIDSIREEVIMSLECYIGPEGISLRRPPSRATASASRTRS